MDEMSSEVGGQPGRVCVCHNRQPVHNLCVYMEMNVENMKLQIVTEQKRETT